MKTHEQQTLEKLLETTRKRFYAQERHRRFYEDKRMLLYALTWPATWMHERGLSASPERYAQLVMQTLDDIVEHGNSERYQRYFPRYLLKCLQQNIQHRGDHLYNELKHIRSHLYTVEKLMQNIQNRPPPDPGEQAVAIMTRTHLLLKRQNRRKRQASDAQQLTFL